MKLFTNAESVEGSIKMLAPITGEGGSSCQNKFLREPEKGLVQENTPSRVHPEEKATTPQFKAS